MAHKNGGCLEHGWAGSNLGKWKALISVEFGGGGVVILFSVMHTFAANSLLFYIKISFFKDFVILHKS